MNPLASIIVPVYNVEQYIDECMQSIVNQTYRNLEIIVVDDGSTDHSAERVQQYAQQDSRILFIQQENGGQSAACNTALQYINGDYVMFVDSDDILGYYPGMRAAAEAFLGIMPSEETKH